MCWVGSNGVEEGEFAVGNEFENEFPEERILPCEPRTGVTGSTCAGIGIYEHLQTLTYFLIVGRGEGAHHNAHRPYHVEAHMGTAYTFACHSAEEIGIIVTENKASRITIYGVLGRYIAKICHSKK